MQEGKAKAFELANKIASSEFGDYSKILANKAVEKMDKKIEEGVEKVKKNFEEFKNLGEARRTTEDEEKEFHKMIYGGYPPSKPKYNKPAGEKDYNNKKYQKPEAEEEEPVFKIVRKNTPERRSTSEYYKPYNPHKKEDEYDKMIEDARRKVEAEGDITTDEAIERLLKKMRKKIDENGEYYEYKKSSLEIEKISSIERRDTLRRVFKNHMEETVSELENGEYFSRRDLKIPDYKDSFAGEKMNMLKKKISDGLLEQFELEDSLRNLYEGANRARALDINGRNKIREAVKEESQMAQRAFNDYLDRRLPDILAKHMKENNMQRLKDEEDKYKDTFRLQDGGIEMDRNKKNNVKSLAEAITNNKTLENFTMNSMPYKNDREEEKVRMLSSILRADKPQLIIR